MIKIFLLIIISFFFSNCSLNENSRIWNKKTKTFEGNKKIRVILDDNKEISKELNSQLKIDISQIKVSNKIRDNRNNFGAQNYSGKLNKIQNFKFAKFDQSSEINFQPLFFKNGLIFFDNKGSIIKYNYNSKVVWKKNYYSKFEKKSRPKLSFFKIGNNVIIVDNLSKLHLVNLTSGELIWSKVNDYPFNSEIKVFDDRFFVIDLKNILRCFYIKDGSECWSLQTENSLTIPNSKNSLIVDDNLVIFNNTVGDITAVDMFTGNIIWQLPTQSSDIINETYSFKNSNLVSDGKSIFFSNNKNEFYSIEKKNGSVNWVNKVRSNLTPILINDLIFTISNDGFLYTIEKKSGNLIRINDIYKNYKSKKRKFLKPIGFSLGLNKIYLTNNNGRLKVIELNSGNVINSKKISRENISKPFIYNNNLFVIKNGAIVQYD